MYLARLVLERGEWDATLSYYAGYNEEEIEPVFLLMLDYLHGPVIHDAFFKKYASKKFLKGKPFWYVFITILLTCQASMVVRNWVKIHAAEYINTLRHNHSASSKEQVTIDAFGSR
jgi:G2/mitotic-specific cyclin 1/2